jgi:hypothetical protein
MFDYRGCIYISLVPTCSGVGGRQYSGGPDLAATTSYIDRGWSGKYLSYRMGNHFTTPRAENGKEGDRIVSPVQPLTKASMCLPVQGDTALSTNPCEPWQSHGNSLKYSHLTGCFPRQVCKLLLTPCPGIKCQTPTNHCTEKVCVS